MRKHKILRPLVGVFAIAVVLPYPLPQAVGTSEEVDFIVNNSNNVSDLTVHEIREIFVGQKTSWPNGMRISVLMLAKGRPRADQSDARPVQDGRSGLHQVFSARRLHRQNHRAAERHCVVGTGQTIYRREPREQSGTSTEAISTKPQKLSSG
jgi:hypothetical protein